MTERTEYRKPTWKWLIGTDRRWNSVQVAVRRLCNYHSDWVSAQSEIQQAWDGPRLWGRIWAQGGSPLPESDCGGEYLDAVEVLMPLDSEGYLRTEDWRRPECVGIVRYTGHSGALHETRTPACLLGEAWEVYEELLEDAASAPVPLDNRPLIRPISARGWAPSFWVKNPHWDGLADWERSIEQENAAL